MMRAAIYARRSTDEHQAASLDVQLGEARAYCEAKGWAVDEAHVFIEDAVSRAEFVKRPALIRMLNGAKDGAFEVVVVRDETRLGGDVTRTGLLIQDLVETGCELYYYFSDERVSLDGAVDKFMVAARNFAAELEREKISQRTREHLMVKARKGLNAGGKAYGYRATRTANGEPTLEIVEGEAEIVRRIFRMFAEGQGYTSIAKALNAEGIAPPRAGKRGTGSWSKMQIRSMLTKERYRGVVEWGRFAKAYKGGTKVRERRPDCEVLRIDAPHLRIIDEELWQRVAARMEKNRTVYGHNAPKGKAARQLLSGLARCSECGGPMHAELARFGGETIRLYACSYHRGRGDAVCTNKLRRPALAIERELIERLKQELDREELVLEIIDDLKRQLKERASTAAPDISELEARAAELRQEVANGSEALFRLGHSPALTEGLARREKELQHIEARLQAVRAAPGAIDLEIRALEDRVRSTIANLQTRLDGQREQVRQALESLLTGPLVFTPTELDDGRRRYTVSGAMAPISEGNPPPGECIESTSPRGFEPLLPA